MSSAICFNLDQSKILLSDNGLNSAAIICAVFGHSVDPESFCKYLKFHFINKNRTFHLYVHFRQWVNPSISRSIKKKCKIIY